MRYSYEIRPQPVELSAGWKLTLLEERQEVSGDVFPVLAEGLQAGLNWWHGLTEERRAHWLMMASSALPAAARHAYLLAEAYNDAQDVADDWLDSRVQ